MVPQYTVRKNPTETIANRKQKVVENQVSFLLARPTQSKRITHFFAFQVQGKPLRTTYFQRKNMGSSNKFDSCPGAPPSSLASTSEIVPQVAKLSMSLVQMNVRQALACGRKSWRRKILTIPRLEESRRGRETDWEYGMQMKPLHSTPGWRDGEGLTMLSFCLYSPNDFALARFLRSKARRHRGRPCARGPLAGSASPCHLGKSSRNKYLCF